MGAPTMQVQQSDQPTGKSGVGGNTITMPGSGQPVIGEPNKYSNTVGSWDNQPQVPLPIGKGMGQNPGQMTGKGA